MLELPLPEEDAAVKAAHTLCGRLREVIGYGREVTGGYGRLREVTGSYGRLQEGGK